MADGPVARAAKSRAARMGFPGSYVYAKDEPPVLVLAANGVDQIVDVAATEAKYAHLYQDTLVD